MKGKLIIWLLLIATTPLLAQAPLGFNYQGIARQADGTPISNQTIGIRVSITDGAQGPSQFTEEHFPETNSFGLFTLVVGQGNGNRTLNSVDWSGGNLWLQIEMDPENNGNYILMGSQQLMSVPYALYAQQSGGGLSPGYGLDITNGTISNVLPDIPVTLTGTGDVEVTGSYPNFTINSVSSADGDTDVTNELQTLSKTGSTVTLSNGGGSFTDEVNDADADATNEIQDLQLVGNILTITNNGTATSIDLSPYLDNTDTHLTESEVDAFVSNNGYLTSEVDASTTNEIQDLQLAGNTLTITNNGTATSIDLSPYLDNTDNQNLSSVLGQGNSAGNAQIKNLANPTVAQDAATKNYVDAQDATLQSSITTNATNITAEATTRATADTNLQNELNTTQSGAGLNTNGGYTADATTNYLTGATNLKNADKLLDTQVAANEADIATNASNIGALATAVSTTYAFEGTFSISESTAVSSKDVSLTDNYDNFNVLSSTQFTAQEDGVYVFIVHAQIPVFDANFRSLTLQVNGVNYIIPSTTEYNGNIRFFEKTVMANLTTGQSVKLIVTTVAGMSNPMTGTFSGFKL